MEDHLQDLDSEICAVLARSPSPTPVSDTAWMPSAIVQGICRHRHLGVGGTVRGLPEQTNWPAPIAVPSLGQIRKTWLTPKIRPHIRGGRARAQSPGHSRGVQRTPSLCCTTAGPRHPLEANDLVLRLELVRLEDQVHRPQVVVAICLRRLASCDLRQQVRVARTRCWHANAAGRRESRTAVGDRRRRAVVPSSVLTLTQ